MKKKLSALLLALTMALSLCACGSSETELTLENYSQYLDVHASSGTSVMAEDYVSVTPTKVGEGITTSMVKALYPRLEVTGTSTNFNYNNVNVKVEITGSYEGFQNGVSGTESIGRQEFVYTLETTTDIAGNGVAYEICDLSGAVTDNKVVDYEFEVIEVSGTVSPVK